MIAELIVNSTEECNCTELMLEEGFGEKGGTQDLKKYIMEYYSSK